MMRGHQSSGTPWLRATHSPNVLTGLGALLVCGQTVVAPHGRPSLHADILARFGVTLVAIRREEQAGGPPTVMVLGPHGEMLRGGRLHLVGDEAAITRIGELE